MRNNAAIMRTEKFTYIFFHSNSQIYGRSGGRETVFAENAAPGICLGIGRNGLPVIFHKNFSGDSFLTSVTKDGKSETKMLSELLNFTAAQHCVYYQTERSGTYFIYANEQEDNGLFVEELSMSGTSSARLGSFVPMKEVPFYVFGSGAPILFAIDNDSSMNMFVKHGGTDFSKHTVSNSGKLVSDVSCIKHEGKLHIGYVIEQGGTSSVVYKCFENGKVSSGKILLKCRGAAKTFLFISQGVLFVFLLCRGKAFYVFSDDGGKKFSSVSKFFKNVECVGKIKFMSRNENAFEVPVDLEYNILLIDDFDPRRENKETDARFGMLKEQLMSYENAIKEKDNRVNEIAGALAQSQKENEKVLYSWRVQLEQAQERLETLSAKELKSSA